MVAADGGFAVFVLTCGVVSRRVFASLRASVIQPPHRAVIRLIQLRQLPFGISRRVQVDRPAREHPVDRRLSADRERADGGGEQE